jgi:hypothetical protein
MSFIVQLVKHKPSDEISAKIRADMSFRNIWHARLYKGKWQAGFAASIGVITAVCGLAMQLWREASFGDYVALLVGLATILTLIGSVSFALLLYYMQAIPSASDQLYGNFQGQVRDLRDFLDEQFENGIIDDSYEDALDELEGITSKEFNLVSNVNDIIVPLLELFTTEQREQLERTGNYQKVGRGVGFRLMKIEEIMHGQFLMYIRKVTFFGIRDPVRRTFTTLAILIFGLLVSTIYFESFFKPILYGLAIGIGVMTLLLIIEFRMMARRESESVDYSIHQVYEKDNDDTSSAG